VVVVITVTKPKTKYARRRQRERGGERDMTRKAISIHRCDFTGASATLKLKRNLPRAFPSFQPIRLL
jgi:hypothetical protein